MLDRRQNARDKVIYGGVAEIDESSAARDCVVRNISENGARIEFSNVIKLPKEADVADDRAQRPFLSRQDHLVARQFRRRCLQMGNLIGAPVSDIEERLRKSETKKRELQRRIRELLGEG